VKSVADSLSASDVLQPLSWLQLTCGLQCGFPRLAHHQAQINYAYYIRNVNYLRYWKIGFLPSAMDKLRGLIAYYDPSKPFHS
jgi:hypothetical protein